MQTATTVRKLKTRSLTREGKWRDNLGEETTIEYYVLEPSDFTPTPAAAQLFAEYEEKDGAKIETKSGLDGMLAVLNEALSPQSARGRAKMDEPSKNVFAIAKQFAVYMKVDTEDSDGINPTVWAAIPEMIRNSLSE